ncbi:retron system putative HNH endonuclease [Proteus sp. CD3]|uniref:retron system putative HNH endonuclease n=1 Tax=Proteus sp. CD3 TaxID=1921565 RepID=UPI00124A6CA6|nr:retron system putative HNH endonuclease [Proteus sp. CD3]QEZ91933.1 TIGR02646 family protein [Proteus sp. CD3]
MKYINKKKEPKSLTEYRMEEGAVYDGSGFKNVKIDIKMQLLIEQGYLCAYCMQRIDFNNMKVEHFLCQSKYSDEQLNYMNLLGCCLGGESNIKRNQTCDTRKGALDVLFSPAISSHNIEIKLKYNTLSGKIESEDKVFNEQLQCVLNLNDHRLISNRKNSLIAVENILGNKSGCRTKGQIQNIINSYEKVDGDNKFKEYYGIVLFYLKKKLSKIK